MRAHRITRTIYSGYGALLALAVAFSSGCQKDKGHRVTQPEPEPTSKPPRITAVVPNQGSVEGGETVSVQGKNFMEQTEVFFGQNTAMSVTFQSATRLSVVTPPGDAPGTVDVTARTDEGEDTLENGFTYVELIPGPVVQEVDPPAGPLAGGNTVTITGLNFTEQTTVFFAQNEAPAVTVLSETELDVVAPPGDATGLVDVTARTEVAEFVKTDAYVYAEPEIDTITPAEGPLGGGTQITITGRWFTDEEHDTTVKLGANEANLTSVEATKIVAITPPGDAIGPVDVAVTSFYGTAVLEDGFTYRKPPPREPTIDTISPTSGPARGGTPVVIKGSGYTVPGLTATLCDVDLVDLVIVDDTTLQGKTPPGEIGQVCDVVVTTDEGIARLPSAFTYVCDFPLVTVVFPLGGLTTDDELVIEGTAQDEDGVAAVAINGEPVETDDQFAHFHLTVSVEVGENSFVISAEDAVGCSAPQAAEITVVRFVLEPVDGPVGVTFDPAGDIVYSDHVQQAVFAIDPETGQRRTIHQPVRAWDVDLNVDTYDFCVGKRLLELPVTGGTVTLLGTGSHTTFRALVREDEGSLLATSDSNEGGLYRLLSGETTAKQLVDPNPGAPVLKSPQGIALRQNGTILVSDFAQGTVLTINPETGARQILTGQGVGQGPQLLSPGPLVMLDDTRLVVASSDPEVVLYEVDVTTGDRLVLSGAQRGKGPSPQLAIDLSLHPAFDVDVTADGEIILSDPGTPALFRVDPETGDRVTVVDGSFGNGPKLNQPQGVNATLDGLLVVERSKGELYRVDYTTANRSLISGEGMGSGPLASVATGVVECGGAAYVSGFGSKNILRIDLATGARTVLSGATAGTGPLLEGPVAIWCETTAGLLIADQTARAVVRVALPNGNRTIVSGPARGTGPDLANLTSVTTTGDQIVVTTLLGDVIRIDPATGNRNIIAQVDLANGVLSGVAAWKDTSVLLLTHKSMLLLDVTGGALQMLSSPDQGEGPVLVRGTGVAADGAGRIYVADLTRAAVFQIQETSGDRILFSR